MADQSGIEWTDSTFNPWEGCTKVGPGCDHCYAEARNIRFNGGNWGPGAPRRRTSVQNWNKPLKWNNERFYECRSCAHRGPVKFSDGAGHWLCYKCQSGDTLPARRRVFCASLADVFDNEVPIEWLVDLLDLIRQTPYLDWLLLTKRIGNWRRRITSARRWAFTHDRHEVGGFISSWDVDKQIPPENVWLGATIVNQEEAVRDIPKLLQVPARIRFLSMEPLLGLVNIQPLLVRGDADLQATDPLAAGMLADGEKTGHAWIRPAVDWVIVGGESGPKARSMHPDWVRSIRAQCQAAGVPFFMKQMGGPVKRAMPAIPSDLMLREFPYGI